MTVRERKEESEMHPNHPYSKEEREGEGERAEGGVQCSKRDGWGGVREVQGAQTVRSRESWGLSGVL
jgi:hypothetical protein